MKNGLFSVFGLIIESEIKLPELFPAEAEAQVQVKICLGQVPLTLDDVVKKSPWYEISQNAYLLRVEGIADYYVQNGDSIMIAPNEKASQADIRVFLLTSVIAQLLYQRGVFVLHGSAVQIKDKATLFLGPTIAGKTALILELYRKGYPLLSDELCAVTIENGEIVILPGIPRLTVWKDTLEKAGEDPAEYTTIRQNLSKYDVSVKDNFGNKATTISDVVIMSSNNMQNITLKTVSGAKKFEMIMLNTFHLESKTVGSQKEKNYIHAVEIAKSAKIYRFEYNNRRHSSKELAAFVVKELIEHA